MAHIKLKLKNLLPVLVAVLFASSTAAAQGNSTGTASTGTTRFTQNVPQTARAIFERAMKMRKAGKMQVAISMMEEAVKMFPDYFDARYALANDLARTGFLNEAIVQLEQARRVNPNDDRVYQSFGAILVEQKKYPLAAAAFSEAARLNPANPRYPLMRGVAILYYVSNIDSSKKENPEERSFLLGKAEESLNLAYQLSNRSLTIVRFYMGMLYEKRGEPLRAADELEQYLRDSPQVSNADVIRGTIERLRGSDIKNVSSQPPQ